MLDDYTKAFRSARYLTPNAAPENSRDPKTSPFPHGLGGFSRLFSPIVFRNMMVLGTSSSREGWFAQEQKMDPDPRDSRQHSGPIRSRGRRRSNGSSGGDRALQTPPVVERFDENGASSSAVSPRTVEAMCPRCGSVVDEHEYCSTCGLRLRARPGVMSRARRMALPLATLIAATALGTGIYAIASQPQTASLQRDVTALNLALTTAHAQIVALQSVVFHAASRSNVAQLQSTVGSLQHGASLLRGNVGQIRGDINALRSSVGQLQGNARQLQSQTGRVLTCLPQLEQQVDSLNVKATSIGGFLTSASLANPTPVSNQCAQTVFGF
ncbi:MAG: hypothetical protein ACLP01_11275 [Solirubrobacteraceae bacterium]